MAELVDQDPMVAVVEVRPERDAVKDLTSHRWCAVSGNVMVGRRQADVRRERRHREHELVVVETQLVRTDLGSEVRHELPLLPAVPEVIGR